VHDYEFEHFAAAMHAPYLRIHNDDMVETILREADEVARSGRPVLVEVDIDYARKTFFTKGVVKANLHRLPLPDRARFIGRAVMRKFTE
jgi:acetolactate synthase-1/2/3 large subunit